MNSEPLEKSQSVAPESSASEQKTGFYSFGLSFLRRVANKAFGRLNVKSRYTAIFLLLIVSAFSSWHYSKPPDKPDILAPVFSVRWWLRPIERGNLLRLPVIYSDSEPVEYKANKDELFLSYQETSTKQYKYLSIRADAKIKFGETKREISETKIKTDRFDETFEVNIDQFSSKKPLINPEQTKAILTLSKQYPNYRITLIGYSETANNIIGQFSNERDPNSGFRLAETYERELVSRGIDSKRIIIRGAEKGIGERSGKIGLVVVEFVGTRTRQEEIIKQKATKEVGGNIEWSKINASKTPLVESDILSLGESWAVTKNLDVILFNEGGGKWVPIAVNKGYLEEYLKEEETAYEFKFEDGKYKWRKKVHGSDLIGGLETGTGTQKPSDSNNKWLGKSFHQSYPAPIAYVISGIICLLVLIIVSARSGFKTEIENGIVEHFASDAPITSAKNDCLGFNIIAKSISQFLRNEKTAPPLTFAITGRWGSGKSSLMQLLAADLKSYRIRPVWLNAWHHQNESQFLYGLLNAISSQGIPHFFSSAHILFRTRLLTSRIKHKPTYAVLLAAVLSLPIGFLLTADKGSIWFETLSAWAPKGSWVALLATIFPFLIGVFSLSGEKLTKLAAGKLKKHFFSLTSKEVDLRSAAGLREQFIKEFGHFCDALGVSTLTIFIDDLDRCNENRIMDVLETVNFLVSSGKCIIIFGMDRGPVERAVANYYRGSYKNIEEERLIHFARRYLEKLVNIEVPVPTVKGKNTSKLAGADQNSKKEERKWYHSAISAMTIILLSAGFLYIGTVLGNFAPKKGVPVTNITATKGANEEQKETKAAKPKESKPIAVEVKMAEGHKKDESHYLNSFWPVILILTLATLVGVENYRQRARTLVFDSKAFTATLDGWMLLMGAINSTPRAIKRFVNRARFLAMRLQNYHGSAIAETDLVNMAGLHELDPEYLELMEKGNKTEVDNKLNTLDLGENVETVRQSIMRCNGFLNNKVVKVFKSWVQGFEVR